MSEAAAEGLDPDRLSFVGCLRASRDRLPAFAALPEGDRTRWYRKLLAEMAARSRAETGSTRV